MCYSWLNQIKERGAFSERTNEIAAVAHPVGMEVTTARCRNSAEEWRRRKEINRRAKEVIRARQEKADEDAAARAAHTGDVVRQSAAGATEKRKRQRQAEKNKRQRKNRQVKKMHKEWEEEHFYFNVACWSSSPAAFRCRRFNCDAYRCRCSCRVLVLLPCSLLLPPL